MLLIKHRNNNEQVILCVLGQGLRGINWKGANLQDADLHDADLEYADLEGADLRRANLKGAYLIEANLRAAILRGADLTDAAVLASQFGGTDVCGAKLGTDIGKFDGLKNVEEASKNAGRLFTSMLLSCAYALLIVADRNAKNDIKFPLVDTLIPRALFFWAAPPFLLGIYFYFHAYLQRLWERLSTLPAIFPDGMPIDQKAYPWLMTGLVREYMVRLPDRPALYGMQSILGRVIGYGMVPLTLLTLLAVERQELIYSGSVSSGHKYRMLLEIVLFGWAVGSGLYFLSLADYTLRGKKLKPWRVALIGKDAARTNDKNDPRTIGWASGFILSLIVSIAFPFEWYIMLFFICSIVVIFWISLALDRRFGSGLRQQEDQNEVSEP